MIVVFSSNKIGGIVQFSLEITKQIIALGRKAKLFLPLDASYSQEDGLDNLIEKYSKKNSLFIHSKNNKKIIKQILSLSPDIVLFTDNTIVSSEICLLLPKSVKKIITFHDGGLFHKSSDKSLKITIHNKLESFYSKRAGNKTNHVLLLSKHSMNNIINKNPKFSSKAIMMNLGAHIPNVKPVNPKECPFVNYLLFFGRIDEYKGLEKFIQIFNQSKLDIYFVIAGNGTLLDYAYEDIKNNHKIIFINRYISDSEMVSLFSNSKACVLPYIEATQSGIIPIAYYYGKPVITSNVEGLTQFVLDKKTGFICGCDDDYIKSLNVIFSDENYYKEISANCVEYYKANLDMKTNLENMLRKIDGE